MVSKEDIIDLKRYVSQTQSIGQLQKFLIKKNLRLVLTILSTGFTCMDWDINQRQITGILELGLQIKLSNFSNNQDFLESRFVSTVHLDEIVGIGEQELFEIIRREIKTCIKNLY